VTGTVDSLDIRQVGYEHRDVVALTGEVQTYYREIYGGPDSAPVADGEFNPPLGAFFVAYDAGIATAMGGWRLCRTRLHIAAQRPAEIKRMYVVRAARGRGLARRLLRHLEETAAASGADAMVLETGQRQPAAIRLYRSSGYTDIPRFGHYAHEPEAVHLGKSLNGAQLALSDSQSSSGRPARQS
jgi:ribosomal protein S18 acetylase RimI-like enzyme